MKNKLSACLIVKNEECCIESCLKALREHVDEIVVADTGSTDRTVERAKVIADKVVSFEWVNDFSAARNFAAAQASNDWILAVDADETVTRWDGDEIARFIAQVGAQQAGCIEIINILEDGGKKEYERLTRLYNRRFLHFEGGIHEQLHNESGSFERVDVPITIAHSGYTNAEVQRKNKAERNIALLTAELSKKSGDCYLLYQLGKSHELNKDNAKALVYYEQAMQKVPDFNLLYARDLVIAYGYALNRAGEAKRALTVEQYLKYYEKSPDFQFLLAYIYMMNGQFSKAVQTYLNCTTLKNGQMEGVTSFLPLYNIGVIFECLGNTAEALCYYRMCGNYPKAVERLTACGGAVRE